MRSKSQSICVAALASFVAYGASAPIAPATAQGVAPPSAASNAPPAFDAVSVKPNRSGSAARAMGPEPGGRFSAQNVPLRDLLAVAYSIPPLFASYRIVGGPEWLDSARFDVNATAGTDLPPDQIALRVRRMLADRFRVTAHWEMRELPVYTLTVVEGSGARGSRLRRSNVDCAALRAAARGGPPPSPPPAGSPQACTGRTIPGTITGVALSLDSLANSLARFAGRIVQNGTGLTGAYDYELTWTPDQPIEPIPGAPPLNIDPNGPSLFTALQEQLGLRLESRRSSVEVLVIDRAELPSPD